MNYHIGPLIHFGQSVHDQRSSINITESTTRPTWDQSYLQCLNGMCCPSEVNDDTQYQIPKIRQDVPHSYFHLGHLNILKYQQVFNRIPNSLKSGPHGTVDAFNYGFTAQCIKSYMNMDTNQVVFYYQLPHCHTISKFGIYLWAKNDVQPPADVHIYLKRSKNNRIKIYHHWS